MKTAVASAIEEYLGEVEETILEFVLGKLRSHSPAQSLVEEMEAVLDDDAPVFVASIWRALLVAVIQSSR